jgi:hypothetical protein
MSNETKPENTAGHGSYERQDLNAAGIIYFLLALVVATVLCALGVRGFFAYLERREKATQPAVSPLLTNVPEDTRHLPVDYKDYLKENFPNPRLEIDERGQLDDGRAREEQTLYSYGWIDEKAGTVHIPIERAMDLLVQRGLPVRPQGTANNGQVSGEETHNSVSKVASSNKGKKK